MGLLGLHPNASSVASFCGSLTGPQLLGMEFPEDRPSWTCLEATTKSHCVCGCNVLNEGRSNCLTLWFGSRRPGAGINPALPAQEALGPQNTGSSQTVYLGG